MVKPQAKRMRRPSCSCGTAIPWPVSPTTRGGSGGRSSSRSEGPRGSSPRYSAGVLLLPHHNVCHLARQSGFRLVGQFSDSEIHLYERHLFKPFNSTWSCVFPDSPRASALQQGSYPIDTAKGVKVGNQVYNHHNNKAVNGRKRRGPWRVLWGICPGSVMPYPQYAARRALSMLVRRGLPRIRDAMGRSRTEGINIRKSNTYTKSSYSAGTGFPLVFCGRERLGKDPQMTGGEGLTWI